MAATINGKRSVFHTPEMPAPETPDIFSRPPLLTWQEQWIQTSMRIAEEAKQAEQEWLNDPEAQAEYAEWNEKIDEAQRAEYEADLDRQAEAAELYELGELGQHAIAGHDLVWQAGGEI